MIDCQRFSTEKDGSGLVTYRCDTGGGYVILGDDEDSDWESVTEFCAECKTRQPYPIA